MNLLSLFFLVLISVKNRLYCSHSSLSWSRTLSFSLLMFSKSKSTNLNLWLLTAENLWCVYVCFSFWAAVRWPNFDGGSWFQLCSFPTFKYLYQDYSIYLDLSLIKVEVLLCAFHHCFVGLVEILLSYHVAILSYCFHTRLLANACDISRAYLVRSTHILLQINIFG